MDKAFWRSILKNEAAVPEGHRAIEYVPELMEGLGSSDPELRDNLCVEVLCNWVNDGRFTPDELRPLADQLMGKRQRVCVPQYGRSQLGVPLRCRSSSVEQLVRDELSGFRRLPVPS